MLPQSTFVMTKKQSIYTMKKLIIIALALVGLSANAQNQFDAKWKTSNRSRITKLERRSGTNALMFDARLKPFYHGVASGDPTASAVIIWTRITPEAGSNAAINGTWEMATDLTFNIIVKSGNFTADSARDFTVKLDVTGLSAKTYYYYRFAVNGEYSLIGRTKTAPAANDDNARMRFAVISCVNYQAGHFNGYYQVAKKNDFDAVLFLGDYLYEYEEGGYGNATDRPLEPQNEMVKISDYRTRYSLYRLDSNLRRMHQLYPFINVWDDHESTNDSYKDGAENHTEGIEGNWEERKNTARKVYDEWIPIRLPQPGNPNIIRRSFNFGKLMDLVMLDTRLEGREKQLASNRDSKYADTARTLLGKNQLNWFISELDKSQAQWKIIGTQVMITQFNQAPNQPFNLDAWDGYPEERKKIFNYFKNKNYKNPVFITGDIHTSWASDITSDPANPLVYTPTNGTGSLGVEFVGPSITSDNFNEISGTMQGSSAGVEQGILQANPQIKYVNLDYHGYMLLDVNKDKVQSEWYFTDEILKPDTNERLAKLYFTTNNSNKLSTDTSAANVMPAVMGVPMAPPGPKALASNSINANQGNIVVMSINPNPFAEEANLQYITTSNDNVKIDLYNVEGKLVMNLFEGYQTIGTYQLEIDGTGLKAGLYSYVISTSKGKVSGKVLNVR